MCVCRGSCGRMTEEQEDEGDRKGIRTRRTRSGRTVPSHPTEMNRVKSVQQNNYEKQ